MKPDDRGREHPPASVQSLNVAVVTYNSGRHIRRMLESLPEAAGDLPLRTLVVDNGSTDDTVAIARSIPDVTVESAGGNLGYSGGINVARRVLGPGDLAILNPDLTLTPGSLEALVGALGDGVGIAIPKLIDSGGRLDRHLRRESTLVGTLGDSIFGAYWNDRPRRLTDVYRRAGDYDGGRDVAWGGAAAWVLSAECNARVGPWDSETYFLYSEETDYARRARDLGYRVRYEPRAVAVHEGGGSGANAELLALMSVNRVRYYEKHHGGPGVSAYRYAVALRHLLRSPRSSSDRRALRTVLARRSWGTLPSATTDPTTRVRS